MNETTRCFPRTLAEAFPDERANAVEHYGPVDFSKFWYAAVIGCGIAGLAIIIWS